MEIGEISEDVLDLSGRVALLSVKPIFNGSYSSVYRGKLGDELIAIKVLKELDDAATRTMERKLKRERTVWARLQHRNVLPLYGFANDHELFHPFGAFISPWRARGNANEFLKVHGKGMTIDARMEMWKGVVDGVAYLHSREPVLVHGDLKTANVLIDDHGTSQICDFGLISLYLEEGNSGMTTTSPHTGTDRYLAYELLQDLETVAPTTASDIFALGCIGLEFCFLQFPYGNRKNNLRGQIFADIKAGIPPACRPNPHHNPQEVQIWDLLDICWSLDPLRRPPARFIFDWLDGSDHQTGQTPASYMRNTNDVATFRLGTRPHLTLMPDSWMPSQQQLDSNTYGQKAGQKPDDLDQTVPPFSENGALLAQPSHGHFPRGSLEHRQEMYFTIQGSDHSQHGPILSALPGQINQNQAEITSRPTHPHLNSRSDEYYKGNEPPSHSRSPTARVTETPVTQQQTPSPSDSDSTLEYENPLLGSGVESNIKSLNSLSMPVHKGAHSSHLDYQDYRAPDVEVPDLSKGSENANLSSAVMLPTLQGQGNADDSVALPANGRGLLGMAGQSPNARPQPSLPSHSHTHPPVSSPDPAKVPLSRSSDLMERLQGQRYEMDETKIDDAFRSDVALRSFLQAIFDSRFYQEDLHEPLMGTPEAEHLLGLIREQFPNDMRFASRVRPELALGLPDNEKQGSKSIYMLFIKDNNCLICGSNTDHVGLALAHVRSDIGHRPYHCHCEKCLQSPNPRRFYSDYLMNDHIKGQIVKQKCPMCHNLFQRSDMKRHVESKHKEMLFRMLSRH